MRKYVVPLIDILAFTHPQNRAYTIRVLQLQLYPTVEILNADLTKLMLRCDIVRNSVLILRALKLVSKHDKSSFVYSGPPVFAEYQEAQFRNYSAAGFDLKKFDLVVPYTKIPDDWKPRHRKNLPGFNESARKGYHDRLMEKARMAQEMVSQGYQIDDQQKRSLANAEKVR